jgi:hypothetical protein
MAHDDVAAPAINQPSHGGERLPRPLKRWRLFVAGKGRASLVMQSPDSENDPARPVRRARRPTPDGLDSDS